MSNACLKSMKQLKSFNLFAFAVSINDFIINKLSEVEWFCLKPAWACSIILYFSEYFFKRLLITDVNSLPRQLSRVIGL